MEDVAAMIRYSKSSGVNEGKTVLLKSAVTE